MTQPTVTSLYPPIEPYAHGQLPVDNGHTLYWETSGNPKGLPVLFLHGGPGAGCSAAHRQFFDPTMYRIVLFDQRGAGRSTPAGSIEHNTTWDLVSDIETLREHLGIDQWLIFGGSWGSTLALAYGQSHTERCLGFVLRGIFLCSAEEVQWFLTGMRWFFPEAYADFVAPIPENERVDLLGAYEQRLFGPDPQTRLLAARAWNRFESRCLYLFPRPEEDDTAQSDATAYNLARLEAHYFRRVADLAPQQLLRDTRRLHHLPAVIVQGRYDVICPPRSAFALHEAWPQAQLHMIEDAGHSAFEPGICTTLVKACNQFGRTGRFAD